MTREDFDILVRRVETGIGRHPAALRRRVALLALAGYAVLLMWLAVVLILAGGFFGMMVWADATGRIVCGIVATVILIGGGWAAVQALLVTLEAPEGREIRRFEAPELFRLLDELRARLRTVPFHRVLIVPACNASVVQVPRLGLLGWYRNYLLLGLPLLEGFPREEVGAVVAHEFAHLSRQDGRFGHWLYRLRRSWERMFAQLNRPRVAGQVSLRPLMMAGVNWFWPRFNAHAFVFSRNAEYAADAVAAQVAGIGPATLALLRLAMVSRLLEEKFWTELWQRANTLPEPPAGVFKQLRDALRQGATTEDRDRWMNEALRTATTNSDTHPCLRERLAALGSRFQHPARVETAHLVRPPSPYAAEALLGPARDTIRHDVETAWKKEIQPNWRDRHARATLLAHRLTSLEKAVPDSRASADSLWDKVTFLGDLHGDEAAEPLIRQVLALNPNHALANFQLGRILLKAGKPEGEELLNHAAGESEELTPKVCELLHDFYRRSGRSDNLKSVEMRMDRYEKNLPASHAERTGISANDSLIPHGLKAEELASLISILEKETELAAAFLARKELKHFPQARMFLLCVRRRKPWHRLPNAGHDRSLATRLSQAVRLPGRVLVFAPTGGFSKVARKLTRVPESQVFRRQS